MGNYDEFDLDVRLTSDTKGGAAPAQTETCHTCPTCDTCPQTCQTCGAQCQQHTAAATCAHHTCADTCANTCADTCPDGCIPPTDFSCGAAMHTCPDTACHEPNTRCIVV